MGRRAFEYAVGAVAFAAALLGWGEAAGQQYPERRHLRAGNRSYEAQDYVAGAEAFRAALEEAPASFAASFNLADALYKQGDAAGAAEVLGALAERPDLTPDQRARVFHNLGNSMFAQQKLTEAAEYYKQSLRENPADLETKYNLAYVQKLLEEQSDEERQHNGQSDDNRQNDAQQGDDGQGDDPQSEGRPDDDGAGDREGDPDRGQDNRDGNGDDRPENPEDSGEERDGDSGDRESDGKPRSETSAGERETAGGMSREDAEHILDAMQRQEDKTREKVNARRAVGVARSGKNW